MNDLLKKLVEAPGVSGREEMIRKLISQEMKPLVDELKVDVMGNLIGHRKPGKAKGPSMMIAAHMDQIGFYVRHVDEKKGFIRFVTAGGFDPKTLVAQRVVVHGKKDLNGVIGTKPVHIMTDEEKRRPVKLEQLYIDIGLPGKKTKELVAPGDPITLVGDFREVGDCWCSRAMDDRVGVYVMIEALRKVAASRKAHRVDLYTVATVQEEVGLRGALAATFGIEPQIGIALDVTLACDVPGVGEHEEISRFGKGAAISILNGSLISNPLLVEKFKATAVKHKIPFQMDILPRGGTDAGAMQRAKTGCAAITISIPSRYIHSTVEMVHKKDVKACIDLVAAFILDESSGSYIPSLK
ncbi:MAG: M42 family metallopeptidase [Deltaproteobacteria bacterium]|nr:M42 family metallopeptidase [Deltaproteobacteria bacterium]